MVLAYYDVTSGHMTLRIEIFWRETGFKMATSSMETKFIFWETCFT